VALLVLPDGDERLHGPERLDDLLAGWTRAVRILQRCTERVDRRHRRRDVFVSSRSSECGVGGRRVLST
jgi:hypothetical protein